VSRTKVQGSPAQVLSPWIEWKISVMRRRSAAGVFTLIEGSNPRRSATFPGEHRGVGDARCRLRTRWPGAAGRPPPSPPLSRTHDAVRHPPLLPPVPSGEHLAQDRVGNEEHVGGAFGEAAHEVGVPGVAERDVDADFVAVGDEALLDVPPYAVEHLELERGVRD